MTNPEGGAPPPPPGETPPPPSGPPPGQPPGSVTPPAATVASAYAEWWKRAVAAIVDWILLVIVNAIVGGILGIGGDLAVDQTTGTISPGALTGLITANLLLWLLGAAYYVILNGNERGQTVGKMLMKIQVRDENTGGPAGYGKAIIRYLVGAVLWFLCIIPGVIDILFPLWDDKRQTLHDKAAKTVVVDLG